MDAEEKDKLTGLEQQISPLTTPSYNITTALPTLSLADIDFNAFNTAQANLTPEYAFNTTTTGGTIMGAALGASQVSWPQIPYVTTTTGTGSAGMLNQSGLTIQGENADLVIRGKSLLSWMDKIEQRLNILSPNAELEAEWDELRELGNRYRELEKQCKEKTEIWMKLKKMPPPTAL